MSGDEVIISLFGMTVAGITWGLWYAQPRQIRTFRAGGGRRVLDVAPVVSAALVILVLKTLAAHDVRDDIRYLGLYFLLGAGWVGAAMSCVSVTGISARDDVFERGNASAAWAIAGGMLGVSLSYAGGNIGDGPGWWVVIFSAGLATAGLFLVWLLLEAVTRVSDVVTIDRDLAAGIRVGGFLCACGLLLGRAVAGDWVSAEDTVADFAMTAWPILGLTAVAFVVERVSRPTHENPTPTVFAHGLIPALVYVAVAVALVVRLGLPE